MAKGLFWRLAVFLLSARAVRGGRQIGKTQDGRTDSAAGTDEQGGERERESVGGPLDTLAPQPRSDVQIKPTRLQYKGTHFSFLWKNINPRVNK